MQESKNESKQIRNQQESKKKDKVIESNKDRKVQCKNFK